MFNIYRHIRPDTEEVFYVGKGLEGSRRHLSKSGRNRYWHNIVSKNDGQYEIEVMMEGLTVEESIDKEIEFIQLYGRFQDGGTLCNMSSGGENSAYGTRHSEETKEKMSQASLGKPKVGEHKEKLSSLMKVYNENKVYTPELRAKLASNGFEGKTHSEETKKLIKEKAILRGKVRGSGKPPKKCIGENLITGEKKEFNSYREAQGYTGVNHNHIIKLIKGIGKQCKNWKFYDYTVYNSVF